MKTVELREGTSVAYLAAYVNTLPDMSKPTLLQQSEDHCIYWLGNCEDTAFRCNVYLVVDAGEALIVDPGNRAHFESVVARVRQIMNPADLTGMILCHPDPDVAASMVDWLELNPAMAVFSSPRTNVHLPHYGCSGYRFYDIAADPVHLLPSGARLRFVEAPFLHFPGAFTTFDERSGFLFSGDVWAALDLDWALVVKDMDLHAAQMDLFHVDYMASNLAAKGFVAKIADISIKAILPQHGSIIPEAHVVDALTYLETLQCGTDVIYANLAE